MLRAPILKNIYERLLLKELSFKKWIFCFLTIISYILEGSLLGFVIYWTSDIAFRGNFFDLVKIIVNFTNLIQYRCKIKHYWS